MRTQASRWVCSDPLEKKVALGKESALGTQPLADEIEYRWLRLPAMPFPRAAGHCCSLSPGDTGSGCGAECVESCPHEGGRPGKYQRG